MAEAVYSERFPCCWLSNFLSINSLRRKTKQSKTKSKIHTIIASLSPYNTAPYQKHLAYELYESILLHCIAYVSAKSMRQKWFYHAHWSINC